MHVPVQTHYSASLLHNFCLKQGKLGFYPIHFHYCSDVSGSVVAKNTIRHSNQRCVVVHGTNNLEILENVAFDTFGHCFIIQDGIETGNRFIQNLGAQTKVPERVLEVEGNPESDCEPATFWIVNPTNDFIGNVAAGSQSVGFWIEPQLRGHGPRPFEGFDPRYEPLGVFDQNVVHSSGNNGVLAAFRTYASQRYGPMLSIVLFSFLASTKLTGLLFSVATTDFTLRAPQLISVACGCTEIKPEGFNFISIVRRTLVFAYTI